MDLADEHAPKDNPETQPSGSEAVKHLRKPMASVRPRRKPSFYSVQPGGRTYSTRPRKH